MYTCKASFSSGAKCKANAIIFTTDISNKFGIENILVFPEMSHTKMYEILSALAGGHISYLSNRLKTVDSILWGFIEINRWTTKQH